MQSAYLCVIFHVKHKKLPFLAIFLTWFLTLGKIQDGGQNGDHCWWRDRPPAAPLPIKYTSSCWEDQRLSTKAKSFRNTATYQKHWRGVPSSPPSLVTTVGVLRVRPKVKMRPNSIFIPHYGYPNKIFSKNVKLCIVIKEKVFRNTCERAIKEVSSLRNKRFRAVSEQRPGEKFFGSRFISRAAKTENLVPRSFFAPKQHRNGCYAG